MDGKTLHLPLKGVYFDMIRDRQKPEEYRLFNDYWQRRLLGKSYGVVELTRGYPSRDDRARRIRRRWRGYTVRTICHPFFGPTPVIVFAIDVGGEDMP